MAPGVHAERHQRRRVGVGPAVDAVGLRHERPTCSGTSKAATITDLSSNSSSLYFNFDSFQEIRVVTGGGDVSVQSCGLFINLVTKSGSNVFKGTGTTTFENDEMQSQNVSEALFNSGGRTEGLSGNPLHKIANYSVEFGGPIMRNRLWCWGAAGKQDINVGILNFFDTDAGGECRPARGAEDGTLSANLRQARPFRGASKNDQTTIED